MDDRERKARIVGGMPKPEPGLYLPPDPKGLPIAVVAFVLFALCMGAGFALAWVIGRAILGALS